MCVHTCFSKSWHQLSTSDLSILALWLLMPLSISPSLSPLPSLPLSPSPKVEPHLLLQRAKALAEASRSLMQSLKDLADQQNTETEAPALVAMVRNLATATTHMVRAAKEVTSENREKEGE